MDSFVSQSGDLIVFSPYPSQTVILQCPFSLLFTFRILQVVFFI